MTKQKLKEELICVSKMKSQKRTGTETKVTTQRNYKDRLFRMIFREKKELLGLYNAMNNTDYDDPSALTITTMENAIYMNMKNDLSFLIDARVSLYEHQSTNNPNIPLRNLFYVSDLYSSLTKDSNLYGERLHSLPTPQFVVFYNGVEEQPERKLLRLSDAFEVRESDINLELKVLVLNINPGNNEQLMDKCKTLKDYMQYVEKVRTYAKQMPLWMAVEKAVNECIRDDILADFLKHYKAEAMSMSIYEYDEEKHMQQVFAEGEAKGLERGIEQGIEQGIEAMILDNIEEQIPPGKIVEKLQKRFRLSKEQAEDYLEKNSADC